MVGAQLYLKFKSSTNYTHVISFLDNYFTRKFFCFLHLIPSFLRSTSLSCGKDEVIQFSSFIQKIICVSLYKNNKITADLLECKYLSLIDSYNNSIILFCKAYINVHKFFNSIFLLLRF